MTDLEKLLSLFKGLKSSIQEIGEELDALKYTSEIIVDKMRDKQILNEQILMAFDFSRVAQDIPLVTYKHNFYDLQLFLNFLTPEKIWVERNNNGRMYEFNIKSVSDFKFLLELFGI